MTQLTNARRPELPPHLPPAPGVVTHMTQLTNARIRLLEAVADENGQGRYPAKADVTRGEPTRTRANHYRMIDELIVGGLLRNEPQPTRTGSMGPDRSRYHLAITDAGLEAIGR